MSPRYGCALGVNGAPMGLRNKWALAHGHWARMGPEYGWAPSMDGLPWILRMDGPSAWMGPRHGLVLMNLWD